MENNLSSIIEIQTAVVAFLSGLFLTGLFLTFYFIHKARIKERILLIEKGVDITLLYAKGKSKTNFLLKTGIVVTSSCLGFMSVFIFYSFLPYNKAEFLALTFTFLFGGIGMIIAHYADKPKKDK